MLCSKLAVMNPKENNLMNLHSFIRKRANNSTSTKGSNLPAGRTRNSPYYIIVITRVLRQFHNVMNSDMAEISSLTQFSDRSISLYVTWPIKGNITATEALWKCYYVLYIVVVRILRDICKEKCVGNQDYDYN